MSKNINAFKIHVVPEISDKNEWTGKISVMCEDNKNNKLSEDDYASIVGVCNVMMAIVPILDMEEYSHIREDLEEYMHYYVSSAKPKETKKNTLTIEGIDGNVIRVKTDIHKKERNRSDLS